MCWWGLCVVRTLQGQQLQFESGCLPDTVRHTVTQQSVGGLTAFIDCDVLQPQGSLSQPCFSALLTIPLTTPRAHARLAQSVTGLTLNYT